MKWMHVLGGLRPGGVEIRLLWNMRALGDRHEHVLLSLDGSTDVLDAADDLRGRAKARPVPRLGAGLATARWIRRCLREEQPDALMSYGWGGFDGVLASMLPGVRVPCFYHEDGFTAAEVLRMPRRRTWARRACLPRVARTIVPSTTLVEQARTQWGVPASRVVHIPNGVPQATDQDRVNVREQLGVAPDAVVAAVVGRLAAVKRVDLAMAAAHSAGLPLLVLGDGPERAALERHRQRLGSRTLFAGSQSRVRPWLRGVDLYLSASLSEQHPIAMLEAMDEGLPVVATDVGDVARSLPDEQQSYLVCAEKAGDELCRALGHLASCGNRRAELGELNRGRVEDAFRLACSARAWESAIERAVG